MILYIESPKEYTHIQTTRSNTQIQQRCRMQDQHTKSFCFLDTSDKQSKKGRLKTNYIYSSVQRNQYLQINVTKEI